ncbi:Leukocyte surface antigen CD47 [Camelus dromedarius]|uniref:Leukocyte surface antigen CD47 n=1 Tax=Camelus dromedarius TaxID=9838 RepID=A0A5N4EI79_CAMDR|nr:Leukocyte surface antigen CD47 [Camelus dromedarius]
MLTITVIVGAILFIPGEYSAKNACGLGLIVIPTAILILLQYCVFIIAIEMSSFTIAILILQGLGYVLSVVGLSLCVSECAPVHGPLLISGLGITALAELLGLVYLKCFASDHRTIQPPRKAVEEPLNGAKVECATSKNDAFQILGLLTPGHQFKLVPDENYLALTRLPTDN